MTMVVAADATSLRSLPIQSRPACSSDDLDRLSFDFSEEVNLAALIDASTITAR